MLHMRRKFLVLTYCVALISCDNSDSQDSPEDSVRLFFRLVDLQEQEKLYQVLAPKTKLALKILADRATSQTGERRRFKPHELLGITGQRKWRYGKIEELSRSGDQAKVRVWDVNKKHHEDFELVLVKRKWTVLLPQQAFEVPAAIVPSTLPTQTSQPADSQPTSLNTEAQSQPAKIKQ